MKRLISIFFLMILSTFYTQRAIAENCPSDPNTEADFISTNILFCLTPSSDFTADSFNVTYTAEQLLAGGSQAVAQGDVNANVPLPIQTTSATLTSPSFTPVTASTLVAVYPTTTNAFSSHGAYNFYNIVSSSENGCPSSSYTTILNYLRSNPNMFYINGAAINSDYSSTTSIAKATGVPFTNSAGKVINATVEFYWSNNKSGQFFSRAPNRYCWLAVAEKVTFDENSFAHPGEYSTELGITTTVGSSNNTLTVTIPEIVVLYHVDSININLEDYVASIPDLSVHSATVPLTSTATVNGTVDTASLSNLLNTMLNVKVKNAWAIQSIAPTSVTLSASVNPAILWNASGSTIALRNLMLNSANSATPSTSLTFSPLFDSKNLTKGDVEFDLDLSSATTSGRYSGASINLNLQSN